MPDNIFDLLNLELYGFKPALLASIPVIAVLAAILSKLFTGQLNRLVSKLLSYTRLKGETEIITRIVRPIRWVIAVLIFQMLRAQLPLEKSYIEFAQHAEQALIVFAIAWTSFVITDGFMTSARGFLSRSNRTLALTALPLISRVLKIIIVLLAVLSLLQNYGVNVGAIVAGLGIGGLAFALAAQKTLENLFGGVVLILDQPLKVGDTCKTGNIEGVVEDIGLRSSRIRTADRTLVTIPNSELYQSKIENLSDRDKFLISAHINLSPNNSPSAIEDSLSAINTHLKAYENIEKDSARIRLVKFNEYSVVAELTAYVLTRNASDFLHAKEQVIMGVLKAFSASGCKLSEQMRH